MNQGSAGDESFKHIYGADDVAPPTTSHLIAALASVAVTTALLTGIVSLAEPQRSQLAAQTAAKQAAAAQSRVADARAQAPLLASAR